MTFKFIANGLAALSAFVAALLWLRSVTVTVPANPPPRDEHGGFAAQITVEDTDFIATVVTQSQWSKRAALAASIAAFFQSIALVC